VTTDHSGRRYGSYYISILVARWSQLKPGVCVVSSAASLLTSLDASRSHKVTSGHSYPTNSGATSSESE